MHRRVTAMNGQSLQLAVQERCHAAAEKMIFSPGISLVKWQADGEVAVAVLQPKNSGICR